MLRTYCNGCSSASNQSEHNSTIRSWFGYFLSDTIDLNSFRWTGSNLAHVLFY